jgi:hypothetical protein
MPLAPLEFPPAPIHTPDGLKRFEKAYADAIRTMSPPPGESQAYTRHCLNLAMASTWYSMTRSQESRPRRGYYTLLLPRLLTIENQPDPCTGRLVLQLSDPEYLPSMLVMAGFIPPLDRPPCNATLSIVDITPVPPMADKTPAAPDPMYPVLAYLERAAAEFARVFFEPPDQARARSPRKQTRVTLTPVLGEFL